MMTKMILNGGNQPVPINAPIKAAIHLVGMNREVLRVLITVYR